MFSKIKNAIQKKNKNLCVCAPRNNKMNITKLEIMDVFLIEPLVHGDQRGWFMETFRDDELKRAGIDVKFVQENQSYTAQKGTLRGVHFQNYPYAQSKLVRCLRGEILDVAVDLRPWSANYKKWVGVVLSAENKKQLYIPRGFGHGFLTLADDVEVAYKVDEYYCKAADRGIAYNDPALGIAWGMERIPILSEKDKNAPLLSDSDCNFSARVLVTGVKGQLGHDMAKLLKKKGIEHKGVDISDFDLLDDGAVRAFVKDYRPTIIIHCAAYTAVDRAETDAEACAAVNVDGTKNLVRAANEVGSKFVYISTDYVYGGTGKTPLAEDDGLAPQNVYGRTKLQGEEIVKSAVEKHFILRTSWVFGKNGENFVKTMLKLAKERKDISVVGDQIGSPTYTVDLAKLVSEMIFTDKYGVYNASNEGYCSWHEFAEEIFSQAHVPIGVKRIKSGEYAVKATRPFNSRLDKSKLAGNGFERLPDWQNALERFLEEING
jgi:dTDP-4-dehydrorhamnose reductase/dTDP-4-dehydrorhamnose 3,5-epimerase